MIELSKIRIKNNAPYILPPKIYKGDELVYDISRAKYKPSSDYSRNYFTIESLADNNTIKFTKHNTNFIAPNITYYWSINNGSTWIKVVNLNFSCTLNSGQQMIMKCECNGFARDYDNYWYFSSTKTFNVSGNIMSLIYGDNFIGQTVLPNYNYISFYQLFYNCSNLKSAENLILPATTLAPRCYAYMFYKCIWLRKAPTLPATTLTPYCYAGMFRECSDLYTAPVLPATTMVESCYNDMFQKSGLRSSPVLPATTLAPRCYASMFRYCMSLESITCLATDISAENCLSAWVEGAHHPVPDVMPTNGTFYKNRRMNSWPTATSSNYYKGIPEGWTVVDYVE